MVSFRLPGGLQEAMTFFLGSTEEGEAYGSRTAFVEQAIWSLLAQHGVERQLYGGPDQLLGGSQSLQTETDILELRASIADLQGELERLKTRVDRQGELLPPMPTRAQIPDEPPAELDPELFRGPRPGRRSLNPSQVWDDKDED